MTSHAAAVHRDRGVAGSEPSAAVSDALAALRTASSHPIVQHFPQGDIIAFDHDLRYLSVRSPHPGEVGLSRQMLAGRTIFDVFPPEVIALIEPRFRQSLAGRDSSIEVPYESRRYLMRRGPLCAPNGLIVGGMGFCQDVT